MKYDLAMIVTDTDGERTYEDCGTFDSRDEAIREAVRFGAGKYALGEEDGGHYNEVLMIDSDGSVMTSNTGEAGTFYPCTLA